jgi:hypothetical protein
MERESHAARRSKKIHIHPFDLAQFDEPLLPRYDMRDWTEVTETPPIFSFEYGQADLKGSRPDRTYRLARKDLKGPLTIYDVFALILTIRGQLNTSEMQIDKRTKQSSLGVHAQACVSCAYCAQELLIVRGLLDRPNFFVDFAGWCACPKQSCAFQRSEMPGRKYKWSLDCTPGFAILMESVTVPPDCPALRPLGRWMIHSGFASLASYAWLEMLSFAESTLRHHRQVALHCVSVDDVIDHLPYYTHVRVAPDLEGARYLYHGKALLAFTWIAPWAVPMFYQCDYMELDGSFKGAWPYVYSTPQAIRWNEALPFGMSIHLTEDFLLFDYFHQDLRSVVPPGCPPFPQQPVLSDKGGGIAAFCRHHQLWHLFCHRHLIENAKANSALGFLVARALRERSQRSYLEHRPQYLADANKLHEVGLLNHDQYIMFTNFLTPVFEHGLWHRMCRRISSCSNHAERFHGIVNQHLRVRNTLPTRLHLMRTEIEQRYKHFGQGRHRQILAVVAHLKACNAPQCHPCTDPDCLDYMKLMENRYNVERFPCRHTVQAWGAPNAVPLKPPEVLNAGPDRHLTTEVTLDGDFPAKFRAESTIPGLPDLEENVPDEILSDETTSATPSWEDGISLASAPAAPDERAHITREAWELADRKIAYDIVDGILYFRRHMRHPEELDRAQVALVVWADLEDSFQRASPGANRLEIAAQCTARWWVWAQDKGRSRPFPPFGWSLPPEGPARVQSRD